MLPDTNALAEIANDYRKTWNKSKGVIIIHDNEAQGWVDRLRNPEHWVAGCYAIDENENVWVSVAGTEYDGALMWVSLEDPDASSKP